MTSFALSYLLIISHLQIYSQGKLNLPREYTQSSFICIWIWGRYNLIHSNIFKKLWFAAAKSLQSCPTLCDPIDGSPPGSPVPGILQARTLEWVAISSSNAWKWKVKVKSLSRVKLLATPWTAAYHSPASMWFSRQEYWSGVPSPSPIMTWGIPKFLLQTWSTGFVY